MNKSAIFELYEVLGLVLPGAVVLFGLSKLAPQLILFSSGIDFSAGEFGVFVLIAYVIGHIVQVFGSSVEYVWRHLRPEPSEWFTTRKKELIFGYQLNECEEKVAKRLGIPRDDFHLNKLTRKEWITMMKQMQITLEVAGRTGRHNKFEAIYIMCRGLIAALLLLVFLSLFTLSPDKWYITSLLLAFAGILLYRMAQFEFNSVRELFMQFLQLPEK